MMRLIGRETVAHYDCGHMEPQSVPEGETADIVIVHRTTMSGASARHRHYEWRKARHETIAQLDKYVRTAGPLEWMTAAD